MTKAIIEAQIIDHTEITRDVYRITLQCGSFLSGVSPGQFINLYLNDKSMLLPRPLSICRAEADRVVLVYRVVGKGTKELSGYQSGGSLLISTPLGRGYDLDDVFRTLDGRSGYGRIALVAGGLGVPPMVELAKAIRKRMTGRIKLIAALGFRDETFLIEELESFCDEVQIAVENGSAGFQGNVLAMMEKQGAEADYYLSCGPRPMLKALAVICSGRNKPLQVSLEERMGCGYGACVGCACKTKDRDSGTVKQKKVCKDGPVFFGEEVVWDE